MKNLKEFLRKIPSEMKEVDKGSILIQENEVVTDFYFINSGSFSIEKSHKHFGNLGRGDFLGDVSLLTEKPSFYQARALTNSSVIIIRKKNFFHLLQEYPELMKEILTKMYETLEHTERNIPFVNGAKQIGIIGADSAFIKTFKKALKEDVEVLTADISDEKKVASLLSTSDKVFSFSSTFFEKRKDMILLQRREMEDERFRLIQNDHEIERLARLTSGRGIGVVLSSGGARCISQVGILQALEDAQIPIDRIGGTGIGALIAALYAGGVRGKDLEKAMKKITGGIKHFLDYTFPYLSLVKGKALESSLRKTFGKILIENLPTPFFCISSDLQSAKEHVHKEGELWKALRASVSLPGIFPPVCHHKKILVDGSLTNVLPIDVMHSFSAGGPIIAIDTTETEEKTFSPFPPYLSGAKIIFDRFIGRKIRAPSILQTLVRSALLDSSLKKQENIKIYHPQVLITPPISSFSSLDFRASHELIHISYKYAKKYATIWKRTLASR